MVNAMHIPTSAGANTYGNTPRYDPVEVLMNPASWGPAIATSVSQKMTNDSLQIRDTSLPVLGSQGNNARDESLLLKGKVDAIMERLNQTTNNKGVLKDELVELGPGAVRYMRPYLKNQSNTGILMERTAVWPVEDAMILIGGPKVFAYYADTLQGSDKQMRIHAIDQLLKLNGKDAISTIIPLLNDPDKDVRVYAIRVLY